MKQQIITFFKDYINHPTSLKKRIKQAPKQYIEYCQNILNNIPQWQKLSYIIIGICKNIQLNKCECGKLLTYKHTLANYNFCSNKCAANNKSIKQKIANTNIKKYGTAIPSKSILIKEKTKQSCIKKYGVQYSFQSNQIKNKIKETNILKYGQENPFSSKQIKQKIKQTNIQKYNVANPFQSKIIQQKIKNTNLKNYGVEYPLQNQQIKEKLIETNNKKYGYNYFSQTNIFKNNLYDIRWNTILSWSKYIIPLFSREEYIGKDKIYKWKCTICGNQFQQKLYTTNFNNISQQLPRCLKCFPFITNTSHKEKELAEFCKQYYPNLLENNRLLIKPYELDILIPNIKLALEFNGCYFHSIKNENQSNKCLMKSQMCQKLGYRLIHIWQDQWDNNKNQIKQKLVNIFENTEIVNYNQILPRDWYQAKEIQNYKLEILPIKIIKRYSFNCKNTGYLKYTKCQ